MSLDRGEGDGGRGLSRRQFAAGIAWTTPAVLVVASAPALAASGCFVLDWNQKANGTAAAGVAFTTQSAGGAAGPTITPTGTISPANANNTTYDMKVGYQGRELNTLATISGMSTSNLGLILNTAYGPSGSPTEAVTFTMSAPVTSISFQLYGWNRLSNYFIETLAFSRSVTLTGTSLNATTGTGTFNRTVDEATPTSVTVTATSATAFTTFSMTLTDTNFTGQDMRLGIGDLTVCS